MQPSDNFTKLMIDLEGEVLQGYNDSAGKLTVGIGHLVLPGEPYKYKQPITLAESRRLFVADTKDAVDAVNRLVKVKITQNQFDALCSFTFNLGETNLKISGLLKKINVGDFAGAAKAFAPWNKQTVNGKKVVVPGLVTRRAKEAALFSK